LHPNIEKQKMEQDQLSTKEKGMIRMKSIMDYGMGVLWASMGLFFIFIKYLNQDLAYRYDDLNIKVFGGVCIVYGIFRIYRGYKKNYLKER
jgi:hypothetical protein